MEGKNLRFMAPGQKRPTRCDTLRGDYTVQAIIERIEGKRIVVPEERELINYGKLAHLVNDEKPSLLLDIENNFKAQNNPAYRNWAYKFEAKQIAKTINYLQENNVLDADKLAEQAEITTQKFNELTAEIKGIDNRLKEITALEKYISQYKRTRDVYAAYKKEGYSKKFYAEHESAIMLHKAAKKFFDEQKVSKLPSIDKLKTEYATLLAKKNKLYSEYKQVKKAKEEYAIAKANSDSLQQRTSRDKKGNER